MLSCLSGRLYNAVPVIQKSLTTHKRKQCFIPLLQTVFYNSSRDLHVKHPKNFDMDKYAALNNRLEAVPYIDLLHGGLNTVRHNMLSENDNLKSAIEWNSKVFDYNVTNGKKIRGVALLKSYCAYAYDMEDVAWKHWDSDGWTSAVILAWCVELLQAYFIVLDDIMDQSYMRRGELCWYQKPDVGLCAINDALLLQCGIYKLLKIHFKSLKCYDDLLHEFLQVTHNTVYGQCLDMLFNPVNQKPRFENFTYQNYQTLVEHKTSNYTFCLPVHLAMHLAGRSSYKDFSLTKELCKKLGLYFQSQDDYLDCFGDSKVTGKFGNDIREGKCTWFSVKFLEEASEPVKKVFLDNYGSDEPESIATILELYKESSLLKKFESFDEQICSEIYTLIDSMNDIKGGLFYNLFNQLRKRNK
ncbi:farnesyl pyrophosphate synthase [Nephila pilipes]|uniref:Farnesyl pyrophosphate synthase n=1 Tax=Nephila pilipes TaxID=299642 RepID=A0A8X6U1V2_NEPPI|nr:farnesyl pyrophosphate synthase [Nephila pilipes]